MDNLTDIALQRNIIRTQRRMLSVRQLNMAQRQVTQRVLQQPKIKFAQHIGIYLAAFGEIPTQQLALTLLKQGKSVYVPTIRSLRVPLVWNKINRHQLYGQRLVRHRWGMLQIMASRGQPIHQLDVIIMPLVLFDLKGHRVGMGGGFYDKTLSIAPHLPYRIGLAHDFQQYKTPIYAKPWDESLDAICTPTRHLTFRRHF